ncbi:DUF1870 family protein [Parvibium lacunae]|uniref:DUF1870 family protein n=1 Tax=Parvibium lacunae TaxID=1888893 RepID=A0A368L7W7_9BURK|nr:DUF1870 family protein [Parvibium lacunae]RCS59704.1 DUF1870 family protein [Parvibium lacunae]
MTPSTLSALRRLLFFTQPEAAALIGNVTERSWQFWERGDRPIPQDVADKIESLIEWRSNAVQAFHDQLEEAQAAQEGGEQESVRLLWYDTVDDWATLNDREPILFRPHQSAVAQLCAEYGCIAVRFDAPAYRAWLGDRLDSEMMRGLWAGGQ